MQRLQARINPQMPVELCRRAGYPSASLRFSRNVAMPPPAPALPFSPESRVSLYYFVLFMSTGLATVFGGIWFAQKGLTTDQIGTLSTVPILFMMLINLGVGRIADRAEDWRRAILIGSVVSGIFSVGLFFADGYWGILLFWSLTSISVSSIVSVSDAAALRLAQRRGSDFGVLRAWGTVGYLMVIFVSGYALVWFGSALFVPAFVALSILRGLAALCLPRLRAPAEAALVPVGATRLMQVMKPWFLLPLIGWSMVFATHLILNAYQGLLFSRQGISIDVVGLLIAMGALSEAVMFFLFNRFFADIPPLRLILISAAVSAARWLVMGFEPGIPLLFALQSLHAVTFAIGFLGCMRFIAAHTAEDIAAEAQSLFVTLQQGMSILAISGFGWLAGRWGAQAYFASALFALAGGGLAALVILRRPTGPQPAIRL